MTPSSSQSARSFSFRSRPLDLDSIDPRSFVAFRSFPQLDLEYLAFDSDQTVWRISGLEKRVNKIVRLGNLDLQENSAVQIQISECGQYFALTVCNSEPAQNKGGVYRTTTGDLVLELPDLNYHCELTPYPVAFWERSGHPCVIHATAWNSLDVTDLTTGIRLTQRSEETMEAEVSEAEREEAQATEWAGELVVSKDRKRVATVGWFWHPVGLAWSFDLEKWVEENKWESDFGKSKVLYAVWDYFWDSPLVWLDENRILIWGDPELQGSSDFPENSAVVYDVLSGDRISSFLGPERSLFSVWGDILFSGSPKESAICVWNWKTGEELCSFPHRLRILDTHYASQSFLGCNENGTWEILSWS